MVHEMFPPDEEILKEYYPFNSFGYVIERACIAAEKVENKEEELYYTAIYAKCCECKYEIGTNSKYSNYIDYFYRFWN